MFFPSGSLLPSARIVDGSSNSCQSGSCLDVASVRLLNSGDESSDQSVSEPISSFGKLTNGDLYFTYRFFLFWDGFQVQSGTEASGEGIYLLPFNLPLALRNSPNAVRVISFARPGVRPQHVLEEILQDIDKGTKTGFHDFDAHGRRRRIFLHLLGFMPGCIRA